MAAQEPVSPEWSPASIRRQLEAACGAEGAAARIFFDERVTAGQLLEALEGARREAQARLGHVSGLKVGHVSALARSVSVVGSPELIVEMLNSSDVCAVLPCAIEDIYPRPQAPRQIE